MQATRTTVLPLLTRTDDPQAPPARLTDAFLGDLAVVYAPGPPYGQRLLTPDELDNSGVTRQELRRQAADNLYAMLDRVHIHGQPPALMLSLDGLESSALLAHWFWDDLAGCVPGDLVVGVPARDVVIFTGAQSRSGLQKVRRAVDRVFLAGGPHLLSPDLLVRQRGRWEVFRPGPASPVPPPTPPSAPPGPPARPPAPPARSPAWAPAARPPASAPPARLPVRSPQLPPPSGPPAGIPRPRRPVVGGAARGNDLRR